MSYFYWSLTLLVMTIILLAIRNIPYLAKRKLHIAWRVLLLRALFQIQIPSAISIYNVINPKLHLHEETITLTKYPSNITTTQNMRSMVPIIEAFDVFNILMMIGIVFFICFALITILKCQSIIKNSVPVQTHAYPLNVPQYEKITILKSTQVDSPVACNFGFKAYIILPELHISKDDIPFILEHEYMHIKHNDSFWKMISLLTLCIHWFNPIAWMIYKFYRKDIEIATDEDVVSKYGKEYRWQYANTLIDISSEPEHSHLFASFKDSSIIRERVLNIMKYTNITRHRVAFTIFIVSIFTICFATNSFASLAVRKPIIPEPFEITMTEDEYLLASFPDDVPEVVTMSLGSKDKTAQHDIIPGMIVIYDNSSWQFDAGESKTLQLRIADRDFPYGQQVEIGYILNGQEQIIFASQIKSGVDITFEVPESGNYQFFISGRSSHTILVDSFCLK